MRSFIAINLPEQLKRNISEFLNPFLSIKSDVKWVKPENLHLTIKFLGNVELDKISYIEEILSGVVSRFEPFDIYFSEIGCFPNMNRPRVIWIGIKDENSFLKLFKDIEENISKLGFKREGREFSPHLTIGRVKGTKGIEIIREKIRQLGTDDRGLIKDQKIVVNSISLIRSDLSGAGARYTLLRDFPLEK